MEQRECTIGEVQEFIAHMRPRYERLLNRLRNELESIATTPDFRTKIYRVYSRGDIGNDELKHPWTICSKVNAMRLGLGRDINGNQRPANKYFAIRDLGDIIGLSVVCVFPSDLAEVQAWIREQFRKFRYEEKEKMEEGRLINLPGYKGIH
jgi:ppGpp synthetase/RelA/SpoT-type nucleotidyltranferase